MTSCRLCACVSAWEIAQGVLPQNAFFESPLMLKNVGRLYSKTVSVYGVSPNFYDIVFPEFVVPGDVDPKSGLSYSAQLYTVRGSQGAVYSGNAVDAVAVGRGQVGARCGAYPVGSVRWCALAGWRPAVDPAWVSVSVYRRFAVDGKQQHG